MRVSARNILRGTVTSITKATVNAEVKLGLKEGSSLTAVVTCDSVEELELSVGKEALAIIPATAIIVGTELHQAKVSARNIMCGTVAKVSKGAVNEEIYLDLPGGETISAVMTEESAGKLMVKEGDHACAMFKASSVILGVDRQP